ncbi:hypothetical protein N3K66_006999 [Trichothecium roseum]|uniref:Uncharacterized protein n=1 Tax=Trichothecium roseum TaxID=47278 RepID=A0ACC0UX03_9HYPO|nr:hypothetical protein N3K66_006999 [Trichothecium roseum]
MMVVDTGADAYCGLSKCPIELVLRISDSLPTKDLGSLRLTCKDIESKLFASFATEFFSRKQFMLSLFSLEALVGISKSRLSPFLQRLQFGLECPPNVDPWVISREVQAGVRNNDPFSLDVLDALDYEKHAWAMGIHRDLLVEAFQNLKQVRDVVVRNYNSRQRVRDGRGQQWKSYGWNAMNQLAGGTRITIYPNANQTAMFGRTFFELAFSLIVAALGKSGARPRAIEILMDRPCGTKMGDEAFIIPPHMEAYVVPMLQSLDTLHVDVNLGKRSADNHVMMPGYRLTSFLEKAANLKNLRLNGDYQMHLLFKWLAKSPGDKTHLPPSSDVKFVPNTMVDLPGISLAKLEELSIGQWKVRPQDLLAVIEKFAPTLKSLELWRVCLVRDTYSDVDLEAEYIAESRSIWTEFLERLTGINGLELEHLKISLMSQQRTGSNEPGEKEHHVCFRGEGESAKTRSITGNAWKSYVLRDMLPVRAIIPKTQFNRPPQDTDNDHDESDQSVASDDEMEENSSDSNEEEEGEDEDE